MLESGTLVINYALFTNGTDAPTILVNGGTLVLRQSTVEETDGGNRAAIEIAGGSVDLGTVSQPGGNTLVVRGEGQAIDNRSATPASAIGNVFQQDGTTLDSPFAVEDAVFHALDAGGGGLVTYVVDNVYATIDEDGSWSVDLGLLVADLSGSGLSYTVDAVTNGDVGLSGGMVAQFAPTANHNGLAGFQYTAYESGVAVAQRAVNLLIRPVNDAPTAVLSAPQTADEGSPVIFDASASTDVDGDALLYRWSFTGDDNWTEWSSSPTASHTWRDEWSGDVILEVSDGKGTPPSTSRTALTIDNVAPTLTVSGAASVKEGWEYTLSLSSSDPGNDTIVSWNIDWGDGSDPDHDGSVGEIVPGNTVSVNHVYADGPAVATISATATDEDGTYAATVKVGSVSVAPDLTFGNGGEVVAAVEGRCCHRFHNNSGREDHRPDRNGRGHGDVPQLRAVQGGRHAGYHVRRQRQGDLRQCRPRVYALAPQADGKFLAFGNGFAVARYNPDGSRDTTFGTNGVASIPGLPVSMAISAAVDPQDRIL